MVLLGSGITALATTESGKQFLGLVPSVKIKLTASVERDKKLQPVTAKTIVTSGETIHWNVSSLNEGGAAASGYKAVSAIPAGTSFVAGSAKADAKVVYSIDGGRSFEEQPMIPEKQDDDTVKMVPAPVSMYTHVRFEWAKSLEPGASLEAGYDVQVK